MDSYVMPVLGLGALAVAVAVYFFTKNKGDAERRFPYILPKTEVTNISRITTSLEMKEVIAWFRGFNLSSEKHTPFVARVAGVRRFFTLPVCDEANSLFLGVYDEEKDMVVEHRLIIATGLSQDVLETLGGESIVVLQ